MSANIDTAPSTPPTDPTATTLADSTTTAPPKRKRTSNKQTLTNLTLSHPAWLYLHLTLLPPPNPPNPLTSPPNPPPLDILTLHHHLTTALATSLGLHGSAIPFDILKHEGRDMWIRVAEQDGAAVG
ncbi:hypothetical protein LTR28_007468, partial [Elasticomyces elasticus]